MVVSVRTEIKIDNFVDYLGGLNIGHGPIDLINETKPFYSDQLTEPNLDEGKEGEFKVSAQVARDIAVLMTRGAAQDARFDDRNRSVESVRDNGIKSLAHSTGLTHSN